MKRRWRDIGSRGPSYKLSPVVVNPSWHSRLRTYILLVNSQAHYQLCYMPMWNANCQ